MSDSASTGYQKFTIGFECRRVISAASGILFVGPHRKSSGDGHLHQGLRNEAHKVPFRIDSSLKVLRKYAFAISYDDLESALDFSPTMDGDECQSHQQMAVLGMVVTIRGRQPLMNPLQPNCVLIIWAALTRPRTLRILAWELKPRVCSNVLITSSGVVMPAANAPARPPATQWVIGSYSFWGFITLDNDS